MESEITLRITITHDESLPADSQGIAAEVARALASGLDLSPGRAVVLETPRLVHSGPVSVFVQSSFIRHDERPSTSLPEVTAR